MFASRLALHVFLERASKKTSLVIFDLELPLSPIHADVGDLDPPSTCPNLLCAIFLYLLTYPIHSALPQP